MFMTTASGATNLFQYAPDIGAAPPTYVKLSHVVQLGGQIWLMNQSNTSIEFISAKKLNRIFLDFLNVLYSTLLHLPPLRFYYVRGC